MDRKRKEDSFLLEYESHTKKSGFSTDMDTDQGTAPKVHYVIRPVIHPSLPEALPRPSPDHEAGPGYIDNVDANCESKNPPAQRDQRMIHLTRTVSPPSVSCR